MVSSALSVFFLMHLAFLAWSFTFSGQAPMRLLFLRCFLIALCYDNLVLILGDMGIGTRWYEFANLLRYGMRAAVIPFLTIFTLSVAQNCRVAFALNPVFARFCWTLYGDRLVLWHVATGGTFRAGIGPVYGSLSPRQRV